MTRGKQSSGGEKPSGRKAQRRRGQNRTRLWPIGRMAGTRRAGARRTSRNGEASGWEVGRDQSASSPQDVIPAAMGATGGLGLGGDSWLGRGRGFLWPWPTVAAVDGDVGICG